MTKPVDYITDENFPHFKKLYEKAVKDGEETFFFGEHQVLTAFAKYVVEYFEGRNGHPMGV